MISGLSSVAVGVPSAADLFPDSPSFSATPPSCTVSACAWLSLAAVGSVLEPSRPSFSGGGGGAGDGTGVPEWLGSSLSSITKAASNTAGSGLGAPLSVMSVEGFLARGRRPAALASLLREEVEPDREWLVLSPDFWRACSSAMVRSMAPLNL